MEKKKKSRLSVLAIALLVFLILYSLSLIVPLVWAMLTSLKSHLEFRLNVIGLPEVWEWGNYPFVFSKMYVTIQTETGSANVGMGLMFLYTILYALGCAFFNTLVPCLTAYTCARFPYKFSKVIYGAVIVTMILPIVGSLPAEIQMSKNLGLYDSIWGLWIMKANFLGMYFLVFFSTFKNIPMTYTEAAKIDGANNGMILFKIILPLVRNTFLTITLINFITFWNDYQVPLLYMPSFPTLAVGMFKIADTSENTLSRVPIRLAGSMIMLAPILAVFAFTHKYLMGNLAIGGIKG